MVDRIVLMVAPAGNAREMITPWRIFGGALLDRQEPHSHSGLFDA
jgi:hypothetical protein